MVQPTHSSISNLKPIRPLFPTLTLYLCERVHSLTILAFFLLTLTGVSWRENLIFAVSGNLDHQVMPTRSSTERMQQISNKHKFSILSLNKNYKSNHVKVMYHRTSNPYIPEAIYCSETGWTNNNINKLLENSIQHFIK